ncbi:MAG: peptidoglycan editing factor PgeF [Chlamydiales bacterium]
MLIHMEEQIPHLTFSIFTDCPIKHAVFLRHGGCSTGDFDSLNFGLAQGDNPKHVAENRNKAADLLRLREVASLYQQHGDQVLHTLSPIQKRGDGLMTNRKGLGLLILHADCQAAIFYDPMHHALANIHCGWRGNVLNIYRETVARMHALYGTEASDVLVGISPSLGPEAAEFKNFRTEFPPNFWSFQTTPTYFNLWEISRWQLESAGVLPHHIEIAGICTYKNSDDYFSYRRIKQGGRHGTLAALL